LARANHLRPSHLHECLNGTTMGSIYPGRLAAVTERSAADLARALPDLLPAPPARARSRPNQHRSATSAPPSPAKIEQLVLFSVIRADAEQGCSVRLLAARHRVSRRTVCLALTSVAPVRRQVHSRFSRVLEHARERIDTLMDLDLTPRQIWTQLMDDHDTAISYVSVCGYIARRRKKTPAA
jgi:hypothetical protein